MAKKMNREARFSGAQWMQSGRYADRRDLLRALLQADECYTATQVKRELEMFEKGRVK